MADPKAPAPATKVKAIVVRGSFSEIVGTDKETGAAIRREVFPSKTGDHSEATVMVTESQLAAAVGVLVRADNLKEELVRVQAETMSPQTPTAVATEPPAKRGRASSSDD